MPTTAASFTGTPGLPPTHPSSLRPVVTISVVVNTRNEEANIGACIESVAWADEVLVVDMRSEDATRAIAESLGAVVVDHEPLGYVEPARNFSVNRAAGEWVLVLDADERVPPGLGAHLRRLAQAGNADVWWLPTKNLWLGSWVTHGLLWPEYHPRFFRHGHVSWSSTIHSEPTISGVSDRLPALEEYALVHRWRPDIASFVTMVQRYSDHEAERLVEAGTPFVRRDILIRPAREFVSRYLKHKGFRDGFDGLTLALLFAFYRLVAVLKYWERIGPRDYADRDQGLVRFLAGLAAEKRAAHPSRPVGRDQFGGAAGGRG